MKPARPAPPQPLPPLTAKPDLVKNIGGTTFDIHIHFSETSGKPLRTRLCALSRTTAAMKPLKSKILFSCSLLTNPKGTILNEVGALLDRKGYRIKSLNLINFKKSMRYNPLAYIRSEKDILKLVNALILNTKGEGEKSSEDFWVKAERLYYSALIGYIWYEAEPEERNFITLLDLINASEAREDDEEFSPRLICCLPSWKRSSRIISP